MTPNGLLTTTPLTDATEIVGAFNACEDRSNWRAQLAGARVAPQVRFHSQSNMVELRLHLLSSRLSVDFSKTACSWGDYLNAIRRSIFTVLTALKACGYPVQTPMAENEGTIRMEYDQVTGSTYVWIANLGDAWQDHAETPFKALEGVL